MHHCTEEDYAKFYKRSTTSKKAFDFFKKENAFMCMDDYDLNGKPLNKDIFGTSGTDSRVIEITYVPCVPK